MRRLNHLKKLSWKDRVILTEATLMLGVARFMIKTLSFRRVRRLTGKPEDKTARNRLPDEKDQIMNIGQILEKASRNLPWECRCLAQAIAGKYMLARRNIASTIYVGVARDEKGLASHAWLKCGELCVTGGKEKDHFTVITDFTED